MNNPDWILKDNLGYPMYDWKDQSSRTEGETHSVEHNEARSKMADCVLHQKYQLVSYS